MTSTTSFRNFFREWGAMYTWNLRQSKGVCILYLGLLVLLGPVLCLVVGGVSSTAEYGARVAVMSEMRTVSGFVTLPVTMIFVLVFSLQRFGYLHGRRSVDLYHSLPVRRIPMLLGAWSAAVTGLVVPLFLNVLLTGFSALAVGAWSLGNILPGYLAAYGAQAFLAVVTLTFCMLMAVCSGSTMNMVVSIVLTNLFYPVVILLGTMLGSWMIPGYMGNYSPILATALSPFPAMLVGQFYSMDISFQTALFGGDAPMENQAVFWGWWAALLVVMLAASLWLYTRRKSESAESDLAFPVPKVMLRFLASAGVGMIAGVLFLLITRQQEFFFLGFFLFSLMAHLVTEALYSRGLRQVVRTLPAYVVMVVCALGLYLSAATGFFGFFGYDTWVPAAVDAVSVDDSFGEFDSWDLNVDPLSLESSSRNILASRDGTYFREESNIQLAKEFQQACVQCRKGDGWLYPILPPEGNTVVFSWDTPSGTVNRSFTLPYAQTSQVMEAKEMLKELTNSQEKKEQTLPYLLDYRGVDSISIDTYGVDAFGSADVETAEGVGYDGTVEVLLEDDQAKKLLELLQEAIAEYDIPTEMEWDTGWQEESGFYLHLDVSGFFRLTEDSPWYALAENHVGEIVRQSFEYAGSTASLYISPEMTQVIDYLRELASAS